EQPPRLGFTRIHAHHQPVAARTQSGQCQIRALQVLQRFHPPPDRPNPVRNLSIEIGVTSLESTTRAIRRLGSADRDAEDRTIPFLLEHARWSTPAASESDDR